MAVAGIFTSDAGALNERPNDMNNVILRAELGGATPMFALSAGMSSYDMTDVTMTWWEEDIMHFRTEVTAVPAPLGPQITVDDASWIKEGHSFIVEDTGEYVMVLGITGNVLTLQRGLGGTTATAMTPGTSNLQLVGSAYEEGAERPDGHSVNPYPRTNIAQIFHTSWDITRTAQRTKYRFGDRTARNRDHAALMHAHELEYCLIFGKKHYGTKNGRPLRMMDGIASQIQTNIFTSPAAGLTRRTVDDYIERLFSVNVKGLPNERITYGGNVAVRALQEIAMRYGQYNISQGESVFGINIQKYVTPFGSLTMIPHQLFNQSPLWRSHMYSFHPGTMEIGYIDRTFEKSDTMGSASDLRDSSAGTFTTECCVKLGQEQCSAYMTDIAVDHYVVA
jgi:hypothetical protein